MKAKSFLLATAASLALGSAAMAGEASPVFGKASVQTLQKSANKAVKAKGAYANYYGSVGINSAYNAYVSGYYGRYYSTPNSSTEQYYYYNAYAYAADATNNFYAAYYYSYYGY